MDEMTGNETTAPEHCTYEEFLTSSAHPGHAEWVDGRVEVMTPPSIRHQEIVGFLHAVLRAFVETHGLGLVLVAPCQMKTGADLAGREPDVLFVHRRHRDRVRASHVHGPADLVIEVVSPDDSKRDYEVKRDEYERGGVREYWIVDPHRQTVTFLQLGADRRYRPVEPDSSGIYRSATVTGFWLRPAWLWPETLPTLLAVQRELGLLD